MTEFRRRPLVSASLAGALVLLYCLAWPLSVADAGDRATTRPPSVRQAVPTAPPEPTAISPDATATPTVVPTVPPTAPEAAPETPTVAGDALASSTPTPEPPLSPLAYAERVVAEINTLRGQVSLEPLLLAPPDSHAAASS